MRSTLFGGVFDLPAKEAEIAQVETESGSPDFWDQQDYAQAKMRRLTRLKEEVGTWNTLAIRVAELIDLLDLAQSEQDERVAAEIDAEANSINSRLDTLRLQLMLSGDYDERGAIIAIHAGAGGTESQDWAQMLLRMYLRWAEEKRFKTEILDMSPGEEAGIKSVTVEMAGPFAFGYLKAEKGVHRLVRQSPFDAAHRRHTSFVLVEVMPEVENEVEVQLNPDDLKIDVYRSSGAGGQNVQKTSTAIRITHIPSGLVVTCQNERSQLQNRETALKILRARLIQIEEEKREVEQARLKGKHVDAGWGNQIRSYVLHPYNMVKDHRTEHQTSNTAAVLDGAIDEFIEAYLRSEIGGS